MSLTPHSGRCVDVVGFDFAKDRLSKRKRGGSSSLPQGPLSNLLLDAGRFRSIVLPFGDVTLHLGTNGRLLV